MWKSRKSSRSENSIFLSNFKNLHTFPPSFMAFPVASSLRCSHTVPFLFFLLFAFYYCFESRKWRPWALSLLKLFLFLLLEKYCLQECHLFFGRGRDRLSWAGCSSKLWYFSAFCLTLFRSCRPRAWSPWEYTPEDLYDRSESVPNISQYRASRPLSKARIGIYFSSYSCRRNNFSYHWAAFLGSVQDSFESRQTPFHSHRNLSRTFSPPQSCWDSQ